MSDFEMLNQRVAAQKAARRKETLKRLSFLWVIVAVAILLFRWLEYIGFISDLFYVILFFITVCTGSFRAGRISTGFKR